MEKSSKYDTWLVQKILINWISSLKRKLFLTSVQFWETTFNKWLSQIIWHSTCYCDIDCSLKIAHIYCLYNTTSQEIFFVTKKLVLIDFKTRLLKMRRLVFSSTRRWRILWASSTFVRERIKYEIDDVIGDNKQAKVKLQRAHGECLGIRSRWRTRQAAISFG